MNNQGIEGFSYRLIFGSVTRLDLRFKAGDSAAVKLDGSEPTVTASGSYRIVSIDGISATELTKSYTLSVDGKTVTISPMSYAKEMLGKTSNDNLKNLLAAFYNYGEACRAYKSGN